MEKQAVFASIFRLTTKNDVYLLGGHIGSFTTIIYLAVDYLLSLIFKSYPIPLYSARLIISWPTSGWDFFFGIMADLIAGTFLGFITVFILERTNYQNLILKGLVAGGILWIIHISVIPNFWKPELFKLMTRSTIYISFFTHGFWGMFYGLILKQFVQQIPSFKQGSSKK
jgi:uncharacterized membrane protein (Fun14 family)